MPNSTNRAVLAGSPRLTTNWPVSPGAPIHGAVASTAPTSRRVLQLSSAAEKITVAPGGQAIVSLTVHNPASIVENFRLELLGAAESWATLSPAEVNLFPNATAEVTLTFHPSAEAPPEAGTVPFGVKATPHHEPNRSEAEEGTVMVTALPRIGVPELMPANSQGYRRGRHQLVVQNTGNVAVPLLVSGADPDGLLRFSARPARFLLAFKETRPVGLRVRAPRALLTGTSRQHRFALTVSAEGIPDVKIPATFTQRPLLSRRLLALLAALVILGLAGYLLSRPILKSDAQVSNPAAMARPLQGATPGPPGRPGPAGDPGRPGERGATGPAGAPGGHGAVGGRGATGSRGPSGTAGLRGASGARGLTGATGTPGARGPAGTIGAKGDIGASGARGLVGPSGPRGATGAQGPAGITSGYQAALTTGTVTFSNPTVIVQTPQLPAGNYALLASLSLSVGGYGGNAVCWTTPNSAGINNTDHVEAESSLSQQLALNDVWHVSKPQDSIDLVCNGTATATANDASIIAIPLANVTQTTATGSAGQ